MEAITEKLAQIIQEQDELEAKIAKLREQYEQELKALVHKRAVLSEAAAILGVSLPETTAEPSGIVAAIDAKGNTQRWPITIGNAIEKALLEAGQPMSLDQILKAIEKFGVYPNRNSLRGTLSQDARFDRDGIGIYKLKSQASEVAEVTVQEANSEVLG